MVPGQEAPGQAASKPVAGARGKRSGVLSRFIEASKRFCKQKLQPLLYPVSHMTALDTWFDRRVNRLPAEAALLEFGCGRTFRLTHLLGERFAVRFATDIEDVPSAATPPGVSFKRCTPDVIPFENEQFDIVVIRSVLEHVDDPARTFAELARVTKPGGRVLLNLPNKWDYVSVLARAAGRYKSSILKNLVMTGWEDFPVRYRCNTRRSFTRCAHGAGFAVEQFLPLPSQPSYLSFFVPFYMMGAAYQFLVGFFGFDALQPSFVVILRRIGPPSDEWGRGTP